MDNVSGVPRHVAFIMDGNGRWAEKRGLPRMEGHRAGVNNIRSIIRYLDDYGVDYVTFYAFSTENWSRPEDEVSGLLRLLQEIIERESIELHKNGARIRHIGSLKGLSTEMKASIEKAVTLTENNTGITVSVAFNYGGRAEIVEAIRTIISRELQAGDIDEKLFADYLYTASFPDVDLVIRTGGEIRTSNFMIWQAAYSEYYFTRVLWPDYNEKELEKALASYGQRQRRFGGLNSKNAC